MSVARARSSEWSGRRIVLHADDLGMNPSVTDGILQGFEHGLLTSASVLANAPDAGRALEAWKRLEPARLAQGLPSSACRKRLDDLDRPFDLGIHLNLTQGRPLTGGRYPAELLDSQGRFPGIFPLFRRLWPGGRRFAGALREELSAQIHVLLDHGHRPTHANGHQYIENIPAVATIACSLLEENRIPAMRVAVDPTWRRAISWPGVGPLRWLQAGVAQFYARRLRSLVASRPISHTDCVFGTMTAGHVDMASLDAFLAIGRRLDVSEIVLHPAQPPDEARSHHTDGWHDPLGMLRPLELQLLTSTGLVERLEEHGFRLGRLAQSPAGGC